jgi:broad specificity phosphatase PhoE
MTKFIFVRHGESESNKHGILSTPYTKLTEEGIEQARKTGLELKGKGIKIIMCSSYIRAQQTAETIAGELGVDVAHIKVIDTLFERRMGKFEGHPREHESIWYFTAEGPGYEPLVDILKRAHESLKTIKKLSEDGLVMVVGHGLSGFYLLQAAKGIHDIKDVPEPTLMTNAGYSEVEIQ